MWWQTVFRGRLWLYMYLNRAGEGTAREEVLQVAGDACVQSRLTRNYIKTVVTNDEPRFLVMSSWCC